MSETHFDVIIVGAGLSGIGAGVHLKQRCPNKTFAILEGRDAIGGTWDIFRYPGIRSDSDMHTLGTVSNPGPRQKRSRMAPPFGNMSTKQPMNTASASTSAFSIW